MKTNLCLIVNTTTKNQDLWAMFFDSLNNYFSNVKIYVFVDETDYRFPDNCEIINYNKEDKFRTQFLSCVGNVKEKYSIFISEDYILYEEPRRDLIAKYISVLDEFSHFSFIRLLKGMSFGEPNFKKHQDLFELSNVFPYFYSQSATLWRTRHLESIFFYGPDLHIAGAKEEEQFEVGANRTCQELDLRGLYCYHGEPKRGIYHHDSVVIPHVATALVKGKWNMSEYEKELTPLLEKYNIDTSIRGVY